MRGDDDSSIAGAGDHRSAGDLYSVWYNLRRMYLDDSLYGADYQGGLDACDRTISTGYNIVWIDVRFGPPASTSR